MVKIHLESHVKESLESDDAPPDLQNKIAEFLLKYRLSIVSVGLGLVAALFLVGYFASSKKQHAAGDHLYAQKYFDTMANREEVRAGTYESLEKVVGRNSNLQSAYDAFLAQYLINHRNMNDAARHIARLRTRTSLSEMPFYERFAINAVHIGNQQYSEALLASKQLQDDMDQAWLDAVNERSFFGIDLYAHNLLRMAFLKKELTGSTDQLAAWDEFLEFVKNNKSTQGAALFADAKIGNVTLFDYIAEQRKQIVKSK